MGFLIVDENIAQEIEQFDSLTLKDFESDIFVENQKPSRLKVRDKFNKSKRKRSKWDDDDYD